MTSNRSTDCLCDDVAMALLCWLMVTIWSDGLQRIPGGLTRRKHFTTSREELDHIKGSVTAVAMLDQVKNALTATGRRFYSPLQTSSARRLSISRTRKPIDISSDLFLSFV